MEFIELKLYLNCFKCRIRLIRLPNDEMKPDFLNEMYKWALECKFVDLKLQL